MKSRMLALTRPRFVASAAATFTLSATAFSAPQLGCGEWIPTFPGKPGTNGHVDVMAAFDDGSGPALYLGGHFTSANGVAAKHIARWDGQDFSAVGGGVTGDFDSIKAMQVWDDGGGPALYVGGWFTGIGGQPASHIAKWDGVAWSDVGGGVDDLVHDMTVHDDGTGPALFIAGAFGQAGGSAARGVAKWDGASWTAIGGTQDCNALAVFDDGGGTRLAVGGDWDMFAGMSADSVAAWDGVGWSSLGSGIGDNVLTLVAYDDGLGGGERLFAGGEFGTPRAWDGVSWSLAGTGFTGGGFTVRDLVVHDDGLGPAPALFATGSFASPEGIGRWDGFAWTDLGGGLGLYGDSLAVFDDGDGDAATLIAGGSFSFADGKDAKNIAAWDGAAWTPFGDALSSSVHALASFDDDAGDGEVVFAGGGFTHAGSEVVNHIARWDNDVWKPLGAGLDRDVNALCVFDDGNGEALYVGGEFIVADGSTANFIARWDGTSWTSLGTGLNGWVHALCVFDDGAGPALYAGGRFTVAGGVAASRIAKWDGVTWSALSTGLTGGPNASVYALKVHDDGTGPALYVGGFFDAAGGQIVDHIARWDGASWSGLAAVGMGNWVDSLGVYDGKLIAGGHFFSAGGVTAHRVASWDGTAWSDMGGGMDTWVLALTTFDDGDGEDLYAGGVFNIVGGIGGVPADSLAKWDGQAWSPVGADFDLTGTASEVRALLPTSAGAGPRLFVGGSFDVNGGDSWLAQYGCTGIEAIPGCFGNAPRLSSPASEASIGGAFPVAMVSPDIAAGIALLFLGADQTDASGCGFYAPGYGELMLGLNPPLLIANAPIVGSDAGFVLPIPEEVALLGVEVALQGAAIGAFDPGVPIEMSQGLAVALTE